MNVRNKTGRMIYTIGHSASYRDAIAARGLIKKKGRTSDYVGGCVARTREDAERLLDDSGKRGEWEIFGVVAEWGTDTSPSLSGGWWHDLLRDAEIVVL